MVNSFLDMKKNGFASVLSTSISHIYILFYITVKPRITDTRLIRTVCFVPEERKLCIHFLKFQPAYYRHAVNTDTFYGPLSVRINGV